MFKRQNYLGLTGFFSSGLGNMESAQAADSGSTQAADPRPMRSNYKATSLFCFGGGGPWKTGFLGFFLLRPDEDLGRQWTGPLIWKLGWRKGASGPRSFQQGENYQRLTQAAEARGQEAGGSLQKRPLHGLRRQEGWRFLLALATSPSLAPSLGVGLKDISQ